MKTKQVPIRKERILTVCYGNLHRSRATEWLLHKDYVTESCGVWHRAVQPINRKLVGNHDKIVVMEQYMADQITRQYPEAKHKITVLDVEDPMCINAELIRELHNKLKSAGFKTLDMEDAEEAEEKCRKWINKKISTETGSERIWV